MSLVRCGLVLGVCLAIFGSLAAQDDEKADEKKATPRPKSTRRTITLPATNIAELLAKRKAKENAELKAARESSTHQQSGAIKVTGPGGLKLQDFCLTPDGHVVAMVASARGYSGTAVKDDNDGEILIYDGDGKQVGGWSVDFQPQAVNCSAEGVIVVAGDGKLARFDRDGKLLGAGDAPHLESALADKEALKKQALEQMESQRESYKETLDSLLEDKKEIGDKAEEDRTDIEKARLKQLDSVIKSYERLVEQNQTRNVDTVVASVTSRLKMINAVAITDRDVFYTCGQTKGYDYALWRTTLDFTDATKLTEGLSGCCGQMDIQCNGSEVFVAENSRHRVLRFDRDGKQRGSFGNRATTVAVDAKDKATEESSPDFSKFGGCCNPMNLRFGPTGDVFTAESEGFIKQYSAHGNFVRLIGVASVSGGCKNVALAISPKGDKVYFYDQTQSQIVVLTRTDKSSAAGEQSETDSSR